MKNKANNPLSPGARLLRRNLRQPSALVRKLVIGEAIGEKLHGMVRDRPRGRPGEPPVAAAPTPETTATAAPAPARPVPAWARKSAALLGVESPDEPAAAESTAESTDELAAETTAESTSAPEPGAGTHWSVANIPAPVLPAPSGEDPGAEGDD